MFEVSSCKDIGFNKLEFVAIVQFLSGFICKDCIRKNVNYKFMKNVANSIILHPLYPFI